MAAHPCVPRVNNRLRVCVCADLAQFSDEGVEALVCQLTHLKHGHSVVLETLQEAIET